MKFKEALFGDKEKISFKLTAIYGEANYEEKTKKLIQNNIRKGVTLFLLLVGISLCLVISDNKETVYQRNSMGNIEKIHKGEKNSGTQIIDVIVRGQGEINGKKIEIEETFPVGVPSLTTKREELAVKDLKEEPPEAIAKRKISAAITEMVKQEGDTILLPKVIDETINVTWKEKKESNNYLFLVLLILILAIVLKSKYATIEKEEKIARASVIKELPTFINKILLLLSGGMIFSSAFRKSVEDILRNEEASNTYFQNEIKKIWTKHRQTNASLTLELKNFAYRTGVREFIRVTNIIYEDTKAGVTLQNKLMKEQEYLWNLRKKEAEEKGKIAETKLTFPLVILLLVLVLITIAPTFMEL